MLVMEIGYTGLLDGTTLLDEETKDNTPAAQRRGVTQYIVATGLLGRVDPDLSFAGDQQFQGYRLDMLHISCGGLSVVANVDIVSSDGNELFPSILNFGAETNVAITAQARFVPPGYLVRFTADVSDTYRIRIGVTPLLAPVDWLDNMEIIQPQP